MRPVLCALLLAASLLPLAVVEARSTHPDNKVVDFERSGAWEIWCIKQGDTGEVLCDLNLVIIYKPHPDFRAMIPRVYLNTEGEYWIEIDYEFQTSFSSGYLEAEDGARFELTDCDRPCNLRGEEAAHFVDFLATNRTVTVNFRDYLVQSFEIGVDLEGFKEGLPLLKKMQLRY